MPQNNVYKSLYTADLVSVQLSGKKSFLKDKVTRYTVHMYVTDSTDQMIILTMTVYLGYQGVYPQSKGLEEQRMGEG